MPTVQGTDAFDHGFDAPADYDAVFGTPSANTTTLYQNRLNSLEINAALANEGVRKNISGSPTLGWAAFPFRYEANPSAGVAVALLTLNSVVGTQARVYIGTTGSLFISVGGVNSSNSAVTTGDWHWLEVIYDVSSTTHTGYLRIDGGTAITASGGTTASTVNYNQLLSYSADNGLTWYAGGYWAWGSASSTSDWLGEPTAPGGTASYFQLLGIS